MVKKHLEQTVEVRKNMRQGAGEVSVRQYFKPEEFSASCRLCAQLELPPGASIGVHEHAGEDELFIIQKGSGIVTDNGRQVEVEAGDAILTGNGASHSLKNTGNQPLVVTAVIMKYQ